MRKWLKLTVRTVVTVQMTPNIFLAKIHLLVTFLIFSFCMLVRGSVNPCRTQLKFPVKIFSENTDSPVQKGLLWHILIKLIQINYYGQAAVTHPLMKIIVFSFHSICLRGCWFILMVILKPGICAALYFLINLDSYEWDGQNIRNIVLIYYFIYLL